LTDRRTGLPLLLSLTWLLLGGCATDAAPEPDGAEGEGEGGGGKEDSGDDGLQAEPKNPAAADLILYELQVRSANACLPATGGAACAAKRAPDFPYHGTGCGVLDDLQEVKKSTLDDLLPTTTAPDRTLGITLQYVDEVVGANAIWLMPLFPHNFHYSLPDACDDLGSPYAVRDYYHVRGSLADRCARLGRDEWSERPCWGDAELRKVIQAAHARGLKVMLDLAFNHLGHEYQYYDYATATPVRSLLERRADLWDFTATYEEALLYPEILDTPEELPGEATTVLAELCQERATALDGQERVRRYLMWREAFDHERAAMDCSRPDSLETQVPGFYLGANGWSPSQGVGDNYTNNWNDVKFLYNNEIDPAGAGQFARTRELAFRVINYYLSLGVDAFRLDHANGLTEQEWRYVFRKARFYQAKRNLPDPIFLSESFHDILELNRVFDVLTEGYHHDITHGRRHALDLEYSLFRNREDYLGKESYVLLNLENHDEGRLLKSTTGFDIWRGVTFYALAASSRGALMLLTGQEWGEPWDLGFRRSDYLRGRFPAEANWNPQGAELTALYRGIHRARLAPENRALRTGRSLFLRTDKGEVKDQLLGMIRYQEDCTNTLFTFHRLWADDVATTYAITPEIAGAICLEPSLRYRLVDVFTGEDVWATEHPGGRLGSHIRTFGVYVHLDLGTSFQWLRLESAQ